MRMHNPPHPGLVLREYLGEIARVHGSGTSASHARDSVAPAER